MDIPEKLATRRRKTKQNKNTTQYVLHTAMHKQTQITYIIYSIYYAPVSSNVCIRITFNSKPRLTY
jgi:hypothetical protein